jgi:diguanylate cyclase (GGDEF)-like protein
MQRNVLVIDDSPDTHDLVRARLARENVYLHSAHDSDAGLALAARIKPDLILLDVDLPSRDGFETCKLLKAHPDLMEIPVIFLTGETSTEHKIRGLDLGAVDYITKPFDPAELRARVRAALRTKELVDLLSRRAMVDGLTALWNRAYFDARLGAESASARNTRKPLACIMADVDRFKCINDTYGHAFGDEVLRTVAHLLTAHAPEPAVVCRYGGEEFAILLPDSSEPAAANLAELLRRAIESHPFSFRGQPLRLTCSFGVAQRPDAVPPSLVDRADEALYRAKHLGRNRVVPSTSVPKAA